MADLKAIAKTIQDAFPGKIQDVIEFRGEVTVVVDPSAILEVAAFCKQTSGLDFQMLSDLGGNDYYPAEPRFGISYVLYSLTQNLTIRLKVYISGAEPKVQSVYSVWHGANWMEREIWDMFGIEFEGHPDPRRILMPFDWQGHPLRKDYPLGYEEVQFSFNYDRVQAKKPHPKE
jgi:NADH-quinone oxidoreductase subunit C